MVKRRFSYCVMDEHLNIQPERFRNFDDAWTFLLRTRKHAYLEDIYFLYMGKYCFKLELCYGLMGNVAGENLVHWKETKFGGLTTHIDMEKFKEDPEQFLEYVRWELPPEKIKESFMWKKERKEEK